MSETAVTATLGTAAITVIGASLFYAILTVLALTGYGTLSRKVRHQSVEWTGDGEFQENGESRRLHDDQNRELAARTGNHTRRAAPVRRKSSTLPAKGHGDGHEPEPRRKAPDSQPAKRREQRSRTRNGDTTGTQALEN